jgi:hypothetical protein
MLPSRSASHDIAAYTEAGDLFGWLQEDEARHLIGQHKATVQCERAGRRRVVMIADPDAPLMGAAKQRAISGYIGAVKYTYHEDIGVAKVIGHQIMLKRITPSGAFARWR